ncbi:hypothetical protein Q9R20_03210 [Microbacterium sp. PRF11]|uniref:hypothetical protein n=1 Tax=Microbacterium sp. PRF11 TaxID=2962593 RepID=UPI0028828595|nr:hypothetical protein [Microbacterium sp. PRF11]MDT0115988.1 hypothetical protein [Microbacterium sp. PRF11]
MTEVPPPTRRSRKDDAAVPALPEAVPADGGDTTAAEDDGRLPTAQLEMAAFGDHLIPYVPPVTPTPPSFAPWALTVSIIALAAALFTGWLVPLGAVGVILAAVSLRRRHDSRRVAAWALALGLLSIAFSAGWLVWGFSQLSVG